MVPLLERVGASWDRPQQRGNGWWVPVEGVEGCAGSGRCVLTLLAPRSRAVCPKREVQAERDLCKMSSTLSATRRTHSIRKVFTIIMHVPQSFSGYAGCFMG